MTAVAIGGAAREAATLLGQFDAGKLRAYLEGGANFHPLKSPGAPISYVTKYLSDNSVADISFAADYTTQSNCDQGDIEIQGVEVSFRTGSDDKDNEMYARLTLTAAGRIVVNGGLWGQGQVWPDRSDRGPFGVQVVDKFTLDKCDQVIAEVGQGVPPPFGNRDPRWRFTFQIAYVIDGHKYVVRPFSSNSDEVEVGHGPLVKGGFRVECPQM
jgi:hypothetical protein